MNRVYNIEFSPTSTIIARQARQKRKKKSNCVILKVVRGISYQSKGFFFILYVGLQHGGIPEEGSLRKGAPVPPTPREGYLKGGGQHPAPPWLWDESKYDNKVEITANDVLLGEGTMLVLVNFVQFFW